MGHSGWVCSAGFSSDGTHMPGSDNKSFRILNPITGEVERILKEHMLMVTSIAFSPNGRGMVSGSLDQSVRIWNINFSI